MRTTERTGRTRLAPLLAAAGLVAAAVVIPAAGPAQAAQCEAVQYTVVSSWNGGYQASVSITAGTEAIDGWTLDFDLPAGQSVASAWNTTLTGSAGAVTAKDVGWNAEIPAGTTREVFGAVVNGSGATVPTSFNVNGAQCGSAVVTPTPEPSEPTPDPTTTPTPTPTPEPTEPTPDPTTPTPTPEPTNPASGQPCTGTSGVCDDFETQTGTTPTGWTVGAENCTGTGTAVVDTSQAHSGSRSVRVDGGGGYCNHVFIGRDLPAGTTWFRVWVRHTTAQPQTHTTFIAMNDAADGDRDLRVGGQNGALQLNRESDDATLPAQSPVGVSLSKPLPTGSWQCLEYTVAGGNVSTYLNGELIPGLVVDGTPTADVDQQWLAKAGWQPTLTDIRLGWESYGNDSDTLWYDDVAFGSVRAGC